MAWFSISRFAYLLWLHLFHSLAYSCFHHNVGLDLNNSWRCPTLAQRFDNCDRRKTQTWYFTIAFTFRVFHRLTTIFFLLLLFFSFPRSIHHNTERALLLFSIQCWLSRDKVEASWCSLLNFISAFVCAEDSRKIYVTLIGAPFSRAERLVNSEIFVWS